MRLNQCKIMVDKIMKRVGIGLLKKLQLRTSPLRRKSHCRMVQIRLGIATSRGSLDSGCINKKLNSATSACRF